MKSELINELATALAKVQGSITYAVKDSINPHLKNRYADLASVWDACRKQLSENGLSVVQLPNGLEDNCLILDTTLLHSSGQWINSQIKIPMPKQDPQGYGSALTYARRYALAAIIGIVQDDDDADSATKKTTSQQQKPQTSKIDYAEDKTTTNTNVPTHTIKPNIDHPTQSQEHISEGQVKSLYIKLNKDGLSREDVHNLIKWKFNRESTKDLLIPEFANTMNNFTKMWSEYIETQSKVDE